MNRDEMQFPTNCPNCGTHAMDGSSIHCKGKHCHWMRCICGAVFDQVGRFFIGPPRLGV